MRNRIIYEWALKELDENEDIVDINHFDTLAEAMALQKRLQAPSGIELVRDEGNDIDGIVDRAWADLNAAGELPEYFSDSGGRRHARVPQRFHQEVLKNKLKN